MLPFVCHAFTQPAWLLPATFGEPGSALLTAFGVPLASALLNAFGVPLVSMPKAFGEPCLLNAFGEAIGSLLKPFGEFLGSALLSLFVALP